MEVVLKLSGGEETYERMGARDQVVSGVLVVIKKKRTGLNIQAKSTTVESRYPSSNNLYVLNGLIILAVWCQSLVDCWREVNTSGGIGSDSLYV